MAAKLGCIYLAYVNCPNSQASSSFSTQSTPAQFTQIRRSEWRASIPPQEKTLCLTYGLEDSLASEATPSFPLTPHPEGRPGSPCPPGCSCCWFPLGLSSNPAMTASRLNPKLWLKPRVHSAPHSSTQSIPAQFTQEKWLKHRVHSAPRSSTQSTPQFTQVRRSEWRASILPQEKTFAFLTHGLEDSVALEATPSFPLTPHPEGRPRSPCPPGCSCCWFPLGFHRFLQMAASRLNPKLCASQQDG
ncbi:hypothetical protein E2320_016955 [Naja naja]|nr:hypothetical protein E2320_016955 [Naja naja]